MNQDTTELMAIARANVAGFHADTGVLFTVQGLTYNATKKLYEPPLTNKAEDVPFSVASITSIKDPDIASEARRLNITFERYRRLTGPYGVVSVRRDDQLVKQPVGAGSDRYIVVEAIAPDETSPLELILHCQKL